MAVCEYCDKSFKSEQNLARHRRIHGGLKIFQCDFCSKNFSDQTSYKMHRRIHTGEKPHKCDQCSASFIQKNHLIRHSRMHTGDRPYKCEICDKSFTLKCNYKSHLRIHTGERPYTCEYCKKSFAQGATYSRHLRTHKKEKENVIDELSEFLEFGDIPASISDDRTKTHLLIYTGKTKFTCELCDETFAEKSTYDSHLCAAISDVLNSFPDKLDDLSELLNFDDFFASICDDHTF